MSIPTVMGEVDLMISFFKLEFHYELFCSLSVELEVAFWQLRVAIRLDCRNHFSLSLFLTREWCPFMWPQVVHAYIICWLDVSVMVTLSQLLCLQGGLKIHVVTIRVAIYGWSCQVDETWRTHNPGVVILLQQIIEDSLRWLLWHYLFIAC